MTSRAATVAPARRRGPSGTTAAAQPAPGGDLIHRLASNRVISRALAGEPAEPSGLTVGRVDDPAERAADRLAARALGRIDGAGLAGTEAAAGATAGSSIRRRADDAVVGREGGDPGPEVASTLAGSRSGGAPLDQGVRASFESAFGTGLGGVRVHTDRTADTLSRQLSAEAFTTGRDVYFRSGAYQPDNPRGQQTLAHELAHVVQGGDAVQRLYLDGKADFARATTKKTLGIKRARSPELQAIETAVAAYAAAPGTTSGEMIDKLRAIQTAITTWETGKQEPFAVTAVGEVKQELQARLNTLEPKETEFKARWQQHLAARADVKSWIEEGIAQNADLRLRNSCEWIREGRTKFYVVHETHDQAIRYPALTGKPADPKARVFFPIPSEAGHLYDEPVDYDWGHPTSNRNVRPRADSAGTRGWNSAGEYIVVTQLGMAGGKARVLSTIKHETQHDADKNRADELDAEVHSEKDRKRQANQRFSALQGAETIAAAKKKKHAKTFKKAKKARADFEAADEYALRQERVDAAIALRRYKTEYRAHFYQGDAAFDAKSHTTVQSALGYDWTERQWTIFDKIHRNYGYVRTAWGDPRDAVPTGPTAALQAQFRRAVVDYVNPDTEGFNKFNSVRIDNLYNTLSACTAGTSSAGDASVKAVLAVIDTLDKTDIEYIEDPAQSRMLNAKIDTRLTGAAKSAFLARLAARKQKVAPAPKAKKKAKKKPGLVNPGAAKQDSTDPADAAGTPTPVAS